jgi:hypothetical protein
MYLFIPKRVLMLVYILLFLICVNGLSASGSTKNENIQVTEEKIGIGAFPIIFYSDETGIAGGGGLQAVFNTKSEHYVSSDGLMGLYTQKNTISVYSLT